MQSNLLYKVRSHSIDLLVGTKVENFKSGTFLVFLGEVYNGGYLIWFFMDPMGRILHDYYEKTNIYDVSSKRRLMFSKLEQFP